MGEHEQARRRQADREAAEASARERAAAPPEGCRGGAELTGALCDGTLTEPEREFVVALLAVWTLDHGGRHPAVRGWPAPERAALGKALAPEIGAAAIRHDPSLWVDLYEHRFAREALFGPREALRTIAPAEVAS